jgi:hypothetical protein
MANAESKEREEREVRGVFHYEEFDPPHPTLKHLVSNRVGEKVPEKVEGPKPEEG